MNKQYPVYTLVNECHDCYKCIRECPVKAIKIEDGHASVIPERCIACGNCVKACPSNAKRVRNDIDKAKNLILAQKDVYVSLAPSWRASFENSAEKMIAVLKRLGFKDVSETALGAQEVSIKTAQMLNNTERGLFISSACPVIVDYIRLYNPIFIKNIVPIASPALTHAKMLKEMYGKQIAVVFIGPCIAKKNESDRHPDLISASLTFEELKLWVTEEFGSTQSIEFNSNEFFVPESAYEGSLYAVEGGMNETIKKGGGDNGVQLLNISSIENLEKALAGLNPDTLNKKIFIEALACNGGCLAGPCSSSKKPEILRVSDILSKVREREEIPKEPKTVAEEEYKTKELEHPTFSNEKIVDTLRKIGQNW